MKIIKTSPGCHLFLGHKGEKLALQIVFDIGPWLETYGFGTAHLLHQRKGDAEPYPVGTVQEGSQVFWNVSDADTAVEGAGRYELHFHTGETLVKSVTGDTLTAGALQYGVVPPEPVQLWLDHVAEKEHELFQAVDQSTAAAQTAKDSATAAFQSEAKAAEAQAAAASSAQAAALSEKVTGSAVAKTSASEANARNAEEQAQKAAGRAELAAANAESSETSANNASARARQAAAEASNDADLTEAAKTSAQNAADEAATHANRAESAADRAEEAAKNAGTGSGGSGIEVTAKPGQLIRVKETDENGNPTAWEAAEDMPWVEGGGRVEVLAETTITTNDPGEFYQFETIPELVGGETYIVKWNGAEYPCTSLDLAVASGGQASGVMMGNLSNQGLGADTGEPFCIILTDGMFVVQTVGVEPPPTEAIFAIYFDDEVVHPIDPKYLPDGVPYCVKEKVPFNFTFDGDTTGKEIIDLGEGACLVKMTDAVLTMDDLTGATLVMESGGEMTIELTADVIADINGDGSILGTDGFLAVQRDTTMGGIALTSGLYFLKFPNEICTKSLVKEGATVTASTVRKLDKRCLPDDLLNDTPKRYNVHFELSMSGNNYTATTEQTFAEVYKKAIDTNTIVKGIATISGITFVFDVAMVAETSVEFVCVDYSSASLHIYNITVASDDTVTVKAKTIS